MKGFRGWMLVAGTGLAMSLAAPALASADTITVTTDLDTSGSNCTLRDAITAANTATTTGLCVYGTGVPADPDTINFNLPSLPATIDVATALPKILDPLSIVGPGASQLDIHRSTVLPFSPFSLCGGFLSESSYLATVNELGVKYRPIAIGGSLRCGAPSSQDGSPSTMPPPDCHLEYERP